MSVTTHLDGLKYYAPIAASRLYEHRAIFSSVAFANTYRPYLTHRPVIHMPKETSPEWCRMSYTKPRMRSKSEQSPFSKEKHGFLNRYADHTTAAHAASPTHTKTTPPKSIPVGFAY